MSHTTEIIENAQTGLIFDDGHVKLKAEYVFDLHADDWRYLRAYIQWVIDTCIYKEYLLEISTLLALGNRLKKKFLDPKKRKMKLMANEVIALKRMLRVPVIPDMEKDRHRHHLLGMIDQQTPGIH